MSSNYIGFTPDTIFNSIIDTRYFYGLRRSENGELFLGKVDQLSKTDSLQINKPGEPEDNFTDFNQGDDFYEGRTTDHTLLYKNLAYEQFRWDSRNLYYYINDEGELVVSINKRINYFDTDSSEGLE